MLEQSIKIACHVIFFMGKNRKLNKKKLFEKLKQLL